MALDLAGWCDKLKSEDFGQGHLLDTAKDVEKLVSQIERADKSYPGGLLNYLQRAKNLLAASRDGVNPYDGYTPEQPLTVNVEVGDNEPYWELEKIGSELLGTVGFVLVAGGLGERLGYSDIKVALPVEILSNVCYLEYYIKYVLSFETYAKRHLGAPKSLKLPLAIMVSGDTAAKTEAMLMSNDYFGMDKDQLTLMLQEKVPALLDNDARIAVSETDPSEIEMKPHGHGDVHTLLHQKGLLDKWMDQGLKHIFFFQDTNALSFRALPAMLGATHKEHFLMNSLCVPRIPGENAGAVCLLKNSTTGHQLTINIEYNVLGPLLQAAGLGGDVAQEGSKYSKFPGNCNVLLFDLKAYKDIVDETGGAVPEFVNPKYATADRNRFKKPTRVECMMQEFARLFKPDQKIGCTQLPRWYCFSVVKNSLTDAIDKVKNNQPADCCFSGEVELFESNVKFVETAAKKAGVEVEFGEAEEITMTGLTMSVHPKLVLMPSYACCMLEMVEKLKEQKQGFKMSSRSSLILEGNVSIGGLKLDGAAEIRNKEEKTELRVEGLIIFNKGLNYREAKENEIFPSLPLRVRGYCAEVIEKTDITVGV